MKRYDVIVLGVGGVGSAALFHLARRGVRALGIDRFAPGHDRGSSHGQTRIIRQTYFEHANYVPMAIRSFQLWRELESLRGEQLFFPVGLVQVGPPEGEVLTGVRTSAKQHGLAIDNWSPAEFASRMPGSRLPSGFEAVFEGAAGYVLVERCVIAHAEEAVRLGAELRVGETVISWRTEGGGVLVETNRDRYASDRLIIAAGPWAGQLLSELAIPLVVLRKPIYWWRARDDSFRAGYPVGGGCPAFLYELPEGFFYGFPQIDDSGVKIAEHSGGRVVADPLTLDRELDVADQSRVAQFVRNYLPGATTECSRHAACMYTMTPDAHFVVDRVPGTPQVAFAAGLSGHGFKFTPLLGEALAELALDGDTKAPIGFLSLNRPALRK